jgi:nitroreductase
MPESSLLNLLRKRRSIRKFTSQPIDRNDLDVLLEAAVRAPTSRGLNPWEFIVVDDQVTLEALAQSKQHGSNFLSSAPLAIVIAADTSKSDAWTEDCSIAAIIIQLVAEELGLGSCWAQIRMRPHSEDVSAESYIKKLLELPEHFSVECVVGIGHPDEKKDGHSKESLPYSQVHYSNTSSKS